MEGWAGGRRPGISQSGFERDFVAMNLGDGHFLDISGVSGADSVTDGRAAVYADFDNDGDLDILLAARNAASRAWNVRDQYLYDNLVGQDGGHLRVSLRGVKSGRDAFGAVVRAQTKLGTLTRVKSGGSGFMTQSDPRLLFGLGGEERVQWLEVSWPSGKKQRFPGVAGGQHVLLVEGDATPHPVEEKRFALPLPRGEDDRWAKTRLRAGEVFPPLAVTDLAGVPRVLTDELPSGRPALISFWAPWCTSCKAEMPELERLHRRSGGEGIAVVGVDIAPPNEASPRGPFLAGLGITYPNYGATQESLGAVFSAEEISIPFSVRLDSERRVVEVFAGWDLATRRRMAEQVLDPSAAPR